MSSPKSIAVIVCYLGKMPWYFDYYLHSCKYNPSVEFFIISDDVTYTKELPNNVKFIYMTYGDISKLATQKLGFPVKIEFGYKLCDFKPVYGLLFSELLQGYDFWGQSDIDVVYGDIRKFINDDMLEEYDYISMRHDFTTGCFSLFRNNDLMNYFFTRSKDYKMVLSSSEHYCFDECNFVHDFLTAGTSIFEIETPIESFTHIVKAADIKNEIKAHFDFILMEGVTGKIKFDNGKIIYRDTFEAILYHLFWLKRVYSPLSVPKSIPDTFHFSPTRIYFKSNKKHIVVPPSSGILK